MTAINQDFSLKGWLGKSAIEDIGPNIEGVEVWGPKTVQAFRKQLLAWYDQEKRDLPWRKEKDPYAIWVSEIMLQQTQVNTVIPYYHKFMRQFPHVQALSQASDDDLLKVWQGLGYYSRVKNMRQAAQQVMEEYGGKFPKTQAELKKLKGIGPYTSGAIASIAFNEAVPAIDGNAMRVFSRLFAINADISKARNQRIFKAVIAYVLDPKRPGDFNQALMDLGSSYELPKQPSDPESPIRNFNLSYLTNTSQNYPVKQSKIKTKTISLNALLVRNERGQFLIRKRPSKGLLANLWTVPLFEQTTQDKPSYENLVEETQGIYHFHPIVMKTPIGHVKHVFSHRIWEIDLYFAELSWAKTELTEVEKTDWLYLHDLDQHAFPTVQMKIWKALYDYLKNDE